MCRNIKNLFNFDPPATDEEIQASSLQFVRKLSGFNKPSSANQKTFDKAVEEISIIAKKMLLEFETSAPPKNRDEEEAKKKLRNIKRFGTTSTKN